MKFLPNSTGIILLFLFSVDLDAQQYPDLSGTWYSNGIVLAKATIIQNGNKLSFSYNQSNSSGYFTAHNQIHAVEWNTDATIEADAQTIQWQDQVWKRKPNQDYPDISGTWFMNSDPATPCEISQNGYNLSFRFSNNHSEGYYFEKNKIYAKEWNASAEVSSDLKTITWSNQTWTRASRNNDQQIQGTSRYCRLELSTFYYAAQSVGAVWGRSATEPATPTVQAIAAMEAHLDLAVASYLEYQNCLRYDLNKIRNLRASLRSMSSIRITQETEIIIKELQVAITNAPFNCDHGVSPIAIYVGGVHLGAAQAWASSRQCMPVPMPVPIANVIRNHLNVANAALIPYTECLKAKRSNGALVLAFDFGSFARVPLASLNSIEAHTHIVGIETQLLWAIGMSDCCCNCRAGEVQGTSDCDATCKEYCRQKGYQYGKFNGRAPCLLGVVSGGTHEACDCSN